MPSTEFDQGNEPLESVMQRHSALFGEVPTADNFSAIINLVRFDTEIGAMFAAATDQGLCLLEFTDRRKLKTEFKELRKRLKAVIVAGDNPFLTQAQSQLNEYFAGKRQQFSVPLHTPSTPFRNRAWQALLTIPYGETRSYQQQAQILEQPKAVRAVGQANGENRVSIIIPCHRVIGADGKLTGYGGGVDRKKWLLDLELKHC